MFICSGRVCDFHTFTVRNHCQISSSIRREVGSDSGAPICMLNTLSPPHIVDGWCEGCRPRQLDKGRKLRIAAD